MILDSKTNKVYLSALTKKHRPYLTKKFTDHLKRFDIPYEFLEDTQDWWCRDFMPIQVKKGLFIQYRYFPNYLNHPKYEKLRTDPTPILERLGIRTLKTDLIIDGGNVVKCPQQVIMTDKVFKENKEQYTKTEIIDQLEKLFDCEIVWLPWEGDMYGHTDGIVRYIHGNKVLMTNSDGHNPAIFEEWLNILSQKFEVETLKYDVEEPCEMNWCYINFLQTEQAILIPKLGRDEDAQALKQISDLFPEYQGRVVMTDANSFVRRGGALNCLTWNIQA